MLIFPSALANRQALVRAIKKSGRMQVTSEGTCIICKARNPVKTASRLAGLSGIDSVAIAKKVSSQFSDVTSTIVQIGSKAILSKEKFYVKVIQTAKTDYVDRDIEFAATGALVEKLAEMNALPAKSEEVDRVILALVCKRSAYIYVKDKI